MPRTLRPKSLCPKCGAPLPGKRKLCVLCNVEQRQQPLMRVFSEAYARKCQAIVDELRLELGPDTPKE